MKKIIQVVLISLLLVPSYTTAAREDVIRSSITTRVIEREPVDSLVTVDNVISQKVHTKFNPVVFAQARYIRILWWKYWKEVPFTRVTD